MSRIYLSPPDISKNDHISVSDVLTSNWVAPVGPHINAFEAELAKVANRQQAVALNSGTAALHLALMLLGVSAGDQVICPTLTFAASANPICYLGAEPVFVDSELETWNLDPEQLEQALKNEDRVKAVIVVHLYGQCANMERICSLCEHYNVPLIEDAAEALGASYQGKPAGSFGAFSFFSFNGNKIITTSAGGALLSNDKVAINRASYLATQAREPVAHYEHKAVGYNYRMSNVLAGLGCSQLADLGRRVAARKDHYEAYTKAFLEIPQIVMMPISEDGQSNYWLSCLTLDSEEVTPAQLLEALEAANIEARPLWKPLHLQPVFERVKTYGGQIAADLFQRGLCLPSGSSLSKADRDQVISVVRSCFL